LLTAGDAHLRDYHLLIPRDCVASRDERENERVLQYMERVFEADIALSTEIDFAAWQAKSMPDSPGDGISISAKDVECNSSAPRAQ
jgi:nicotinamidase-related amidase